MHQNGSGHSAFSYRALSPTAHVTVWAAVATLAVFSGAVGCAPQGERSQDLTPQEEQALADTFESQVQQALSAYSELEPEPYFQRFSDDFKYYYRTWYNRDQFEKLARDYMDSYQEIPTTLEEAEVEVLGRDAGVVTGRYRVQLVDSAGNSSEVRLDFTTVMERRDGQWKVVLLHESRAQ